MKKIITLIIIMVVFAGLHMLFLLSLYYLGETQIFNFETIVYPFLCYTSLLAGIIFLMEPILLALINSEN